MSCPGFAGWPGGDFVIGAVGGSAIEGAGAARWPFRAACREGGAGLCGRVVASGDEGDALVGVE